MQKRVYLIHGWDGSPTNNWFPWLKTKLEAEGFEVIVPLMPDADKPNRALWTKTLQYLEPQPDENTYFVGHSMGCQAIQRYLEALQGDYIIGGAVLVAGWVHLPHWEGRTEEELEVLKDWHDEPKDIGKMRDHCRRFVSIFSANDRLIDKKNWNDAQNELGGDVMILENKGHFDDAHGVKELPEALNAILELSK